MAFWRKPSTKKRGSPRANGQPAAALSNVQPTRSDSQEPSVIQCCVPYWDGTEFLNRGGWYTPAHGYHVLSDMYISDVEEWLPRKWQYRGDPPVPVLLPDMLPSSTWESNLRTLLTEAEWDRLRKFCYQAAGSTCVACGSRGEPHVEAHEAWAFNAETGVQRLKGLYCFCPKCHKGKHIGYANRIGIADQVYAHLKWLNDWDDAQLDAALQACQAKTNELSQREWKLDISFLRTYGVR